MICIINMNGYRIKIAFVQIFCLVAANFMGGSEVRVGRERNMVEEVFLSSMSK